MCGRFTLHTPQDELLAVFDIDVLPVGFEHRPSYNVAPSQDIPIVRQTSRGRTISLARWGLVPAWSREPETRYSTINSRLESAADKPAYREPFRRRHCLVPADGFYEWQKTAERKVPWFMSLPDDRPFAFAGLWDHWAGGDHAFDSCTLLTRPARDVMARLHNREPVILTPADFPRWLDAVESDPGSSLQWLADLSSPPLRAWPVSNFVNSPANNDSRCIAAIEL